MKARLRSLIALVVALATAALAVPSAGLAAPRDVAGLRAARRSGFRTAALHPAAVTLSSATYTLDVRDPGEDTWAGAVDITSTIGLPTGTGGYAAAPRAFYKADIASGGGDEDWWRFSVDTSQVLSSATYLFEAQTSSTTVDPVIDVYRADGGGKIYPTPASQLLFPETDVSRGTTGAVATNDAGTWLLYGNGASCSFTPTQTGDYYVRVRPVCFDIDGFNRGAGPYEFRAKIGQFSRLAGISRVEGAVAISREQFPTNYGSDFALHQPTVVVAGGYVFSDALPAAALAYAVEGPLLMLPRAGVPAAVTSEIRRYGATRVIIVGGTGTVTAAQEALIRLVPGVTTVQRVAGVDRYAVARAIAAKANTEYGVAPFAFVVSGRKFPDALSATPMSAFNVAPILYSNGWTMDANTLGTIRTLGITDVCIVGGTGSVSAVAEGQLKRQLGATHVTRVAGIDRYEASKAFAKWACELNEPLAGRDGSVGTSGSPAALARLEPAHMGVASGEVFADALAGGSFAGFAGVPVLLTPGQTLSRWISAETALPAGKTDWVTDVRMSGETPAAVLRSYVFGGSGTVSDAVLRKLDAISGPGTTN